MATEAEVIKVFELLSSAYPKDAEKISNPRGLIDIWARRFASIPAPVVRKAAELHIEQSKWFPALAEIIDQLKPAEILVMEHDRSVNAAEMIDMLRQRREELARYHYSGQVQAWEWRDLAGEFRAVGFDSNAAFCEEQATALDAIPAALAEAEKMSA